MTRWARTKSAHRHEKLPSDATPWSEMKPNFQNKMKIQKAEKEISAVSLIKFRGTNYDDESKNSLSSENLNQNVSTKFGKLNKKQRGNLKNTNTNTPKTTNKNDSGASNSVTNISGTMRKGILKNNRNNNWKITEKLGSEATTPVKNANNFVEGVDLSRNSQFNNKTNSKKGNAKKNEGKFKKNKKSRKLEQQSETVRNEIQLVSREVKRPKKLKDFSTKQTKINSKPTMDKGDGETPVDSVEAKKNTNKKNRWRLKILKQRKDKGMVLLPDKVERKLLMIRKALTKSGKSADEIKLILRKERRRCELDHRRRHDKTCYRCRKPGHTVSDCRAVLNDNEQSMGICFRCGSTEHALKKCPQPSSDGDLPYAKCFVCNKRGHLSSQCPENSRGVFPKGGACSLCRSVNHMRKDCPTLVKETDEPKTVAYKVTGVGSVDADVFDEVKMPPQKMRKIVQF